jgi:hypothetical protein
VQTLGAFARPPREERLLLTGRLIVVVAAPLVAPAFLVPTGACGIAQVIE